ncbi:hypothetical protein [Roseitranquillus sediminis]|uniref:hypothetical protein n=1 Tax=Roseitranquillus sediminis TaxID=2809051 RepID=UPI001D0C6602|nr:hypothetical protein [Roseitranquillus sediminis]MBM9595984.1 hypothetical protein [Roseitranquillus sediminis]
MDDTHVLSSIPTLLLVCTVTASYTGLALRRVTDDPEVNVAIHLAAGIFWTTAAYTARAAYWGLSSREFRPRWGLDYSVALDVGCNLLFAYGCWRAHQAICLLSPEDRRGRVRRWLVWTLVPDAPRPVRRLLGRAFRQVTRWGTGVR